MILLSCGFYKAVPLSEQNNEGTLKVKILNNFLTSGHCFSKDESLQKFRFSFLNILMAFASFFTLLNSLASTFGALNFGSIFEKATLFYVILSLFVMYLLRENKVYYPYVVNFFITTSLILFYFVLLTRQEDEFRLVAFFLALFISYVLLGKKYGVFIYFLITSSIIYININFNLKISEFALSTFFTFFTILAVFLYFFLRKIEIDALEFQVLNKELRENVARETKQRMDQEQMLLHQCRMANMGEMLDAIAHQWRQPLMHINSILLNMDKNIQQENSNSQLLTVKVDEIASLTEHMSQTIEDFRNLFQTDEALRIFYLDSAVNDVLVLMSNQFFDIDLEVNCLEKTPVEGNKTELMQVIIIILGNAIEALKLQQIEGKRIAITVGELDNKALLSIEDNAGGISQEYLEKIFDPYFTDKKQSGGTGLGLYIADMIITKKMSGELSVSNTSSGARFSVCLNKSLN
jgi:signal transduction histidine kinase